MKKIMLLVLVCLAVLCKADVINYGMQWQTWKKELVNSLTLNLYLYQNGQTSSSLFTSVVSSADSGTVWFATAASDQGFNNFVSYLTNGATGVMVVGLMSAGGKNYSGTFDQQTVLGGQSGFPVDNVSLTLNKLDLEQNQPAPGYTYLDADFNFGVNNVVPEPDSLKIVLLAGAMLFAVLRLRRLRCC